MNEDEADLSFSCPGCGNLMDDQDMFDEHEPWCPDLNEEEEADELE